MEADECSKKYQIIKRSPVDDGDIRTIVTKYVSNNQTYPIVTEKLFYIQVSNINSIICLCMIFFKPTIFGT